jgi:hypothetical protein
MKKQERNSTKVNNSTRTRKWVRAFLAALSIEPNVTVACESAKIDRSTAYKFREDNKTFRQQWDDAIESGCDRMESEAFRRAVNGVDRPVYQMGTQVGFVREYSDTLMVLLLKAHKPKKYRDNSAVEMSGPNGSDSNVVIYLPENNRPKNHGQS